MVNTKTKKKMNKMEMYKEFNIKPKFYYRPTYIGQTTILIFLTKQGIKQRY